MEVQSWAVSKRRNKEKIIKQHLKQAMGHSSVWGYSAQSCHHCSKDRSNQFTCGTTHASSIEVHLCLFKSYMYKF